MAYIELNLKSAFSLLYGVHNPDRLLDTAKNYGYERIALTDINGLYAVPAFIEAARERGIRPIFGAELRESELRESEPRESVAAGTEQGGAPTRTAIQRSGMNRGARVVALAKTRAGFGDLCQLLSESRKDGFTLISALKRLSKDLILITDSELYLDRLSGQAPFLYAAITPSHQGAIAAARRRGLPLATLGDALFLDKSDITVHRVLRAIALNKTVGSLAETETAAIDSFFLPPETIERRLSAWPEALKATKEIANHCVLDHIFDGFVFPAYEDPGGQSAAKILRERCLVGAEKRYGELPDAILERIDYELDIIERKGFSDYFLVVDDIVALASRTCGRGSAAASIVSYALGLTNVDPIAHNLYFERFLNPSRPDPPDIDIDFAWDERDELIKAVMDRFGERCARVANHNLFRYRSALRETAKAYGLGDGEISAKERERRRAAPPRKKGMEPSAELRGAEHKGAETEDPLMAKIRSVAQRLVGLPRGLGMHCGGLVITPRPMYRYCPIERSAEGYPLLAWEKEGVEAAGLVKIDLLGNRSLAVIRDTLANLTEEGVNIDTALWRPIDDTQTITALARGDSMGVFYIESPAMRQLQRKTGVGDFGHIVIHSSIIRPAANRFIAEYVRRLRGEAYQAIHPALDRILSESYGILCYQEDVSKTAVALAGFDEAEADQLRKIIAKKAGSTLLSEYRDRFFSGCLSRGVEQTAIEAVWEMMLSFSGYSFCKPHSASYAMVSFQSAYLRVHHGAAFMAAVLSNRGGYYSAAAYISEARRMGLAISGPDIRYSRYRYHARGKLIVIGLMAIANLSRTAADALIASRDGAGPFRDLIDLRRRVQLSRDDCLALVDSGALDDLASDEAGAAVSRVNQARRLLVDAAVKENGDWLFTDAAPKKEQCSQQNAAPRKQASTDADLRAEYRALGFLRDHHPLYLWRRSFSGVKRVFAAEIFPHPGSSSDSHVGQSINVFANPLVQNKPSSWWLGRQVTLLGWPITQKELITFDGRAMNFVSFEDESALFETVLFPDSYERYRAYLFEQGPLWLKGRVEEDQAARYLTIKSISPL